MNDELKGIIKKVQKLYRLADGAGTEEEAHAAMLMAKELIWKYDLSMADVESLTEEDCAEAMIVVRKRYVPAHLHLLSQAMKLLFQCQVVIRRDFGRQRNRQGIVFIGVGADAILARQTFEFLDGFAKRKARERGIAGRSDYFYGFAHAILQRVAEIKRSQDSAPQENALVPVKNDAIEDYMGRRFKNLMKGGRLKSRLVSGDMALGMDDGASASLDRQVEGRQAIGE